MILQKIKSRSQQECAYLECIYVSMYNMFVRLYLYLPRITQDQARTEGYRNAIFQHQNYIAGKVRININVFELLPALIIQFVGYTIYYHFGSV